MRRPTDSPVITLPYGATSAPYSKSNPHAGTDYRAPTGSNIYAPHGGKVTYSGSLGDCGLAIDIDGGRFKSRLCHNSKLLKLVGNQVNEGDIVALSGATGAAVGAHCHWVLWDNGNRVDGSKYVNISGGNDMSNTELALAREKAINDIRLAVGLPVNPSTDVSDVLAKVKLVTGDADNVMKNVGLKTPDGAAYEALGKGPKDFLYWYSETVKNGVVNSEFKKAGNLSGKDYYEKV